MSSTPLNIMVVNGNEIISSSELPVQGNGAAAQIKAVKGQKYLITQGKDGAAPDHIMVKRVGDDLQVFTEEGAEKPNLVIEDFYTQQGELSGMAEDGTYHTYASAGDGSAFSMLEDGASATLLLSNTATTGLVGLTAAGGLLAGMSAGMIAAGALAAVAAVAGTVAVVSKNNDKGSDHHDNTPPQPTDFTVRDGNGKDMSQGGDFNTSPLVFSGSGRPGDTAIVYDGDKPIAEVVIGDDGKWSIPVTLPEDGQQHDLSVGFKDPAGVEGPRSEPVGVGYDTTPPVAPDPADMTIVDGDGKDLSNGGDSKSNPIDFRGEGANPGDTVIVYDGDKPIGSVIVGEDGSWHIPVTLPEDGQQHDLSVGIKDPAGNESERTPPVGIGYDATPPAAPDPADMTIVDGDGKDLANGGDSKANPIDFRGEGANPGDTVIVYDGDKPIGSVIVGEDGKWHIPVTLPEDGQQHDLSVGIKDPAGNESDRTPPVGIGYDATPPEMVSDLIIRDGGGQDMAAGGDTNKNPIDFSGKGEAGSTVIVYDGDTPIGSVIVGDDGSWHIPVTLPEDGKQHDLSVGIKDPAGNEGPRTPGVGIGYDATPPAAPNPADMTVTDGAGRDLSAGGNSKTNPIDFRGENATPGDTVIIYDGDTPVGSAVVGSDGKWHVPVEMDSDGKHDLSVGFKDPAGNESGRSPAYDVGFYENPPLAPNSDAISVVDDNGRDLKSGGDTNSNPVTFSGSGGRPGDAVVIYDGATEIGRGVVGDNGEWSVPVTLPSERDYDLSVGYEDPMNTAGPATSPVTIGYDITPPADPAHVNVEDANGQDLSAGGYTNANPVNFSGSGQEGDTVIIRDASGTELGRGVVDDTGHWSVPVTMPSTGDVDVSVGFEDSAGNKSGDTSPIAIGYSNTPPTPQVVTLDDNVPTLSGAPGSVQSGDSVEIFNGNTSLGNATINPDGSWSWTPPAAMADGDYQFIAKVTDKYGNISADSNVVAYSSDTTVWDFSDPDNPGWLIGDAYATDTWGGAETSFFEEGRFSATTSRTNDGKFNSDVLYRSIDVKKGQTYTFSFEAWAPKSGEASYASFGVKLGGDIILKETPVPTDTSHKIYTVTFVAPSDGPIDISVYNNNSSWNGNDFCLANFSLNQKGPSVGSSITDVINVQDDDAFTQTGHELLLNQEEAVLDLSKVGDQIQDINSVSLEGHGANTLNVSIDDVLTLGKEDLYFQDGSKQLMINGDKEDIVNLQSINGDKGIESWNSLGEVNVNGTVYNVYQSDSQDVELLIQQGIQVQQH